MSKRHMGTLGMGREQGREPALPVSETGGTGTTMSCPHHPRG